MVETLIPDETLLDDNMPDMDSAADRTIVELAEDVEAIRLLTLCASHNPRSAVHAYVEIKRNEAEAAGETLSYEAAQDLRAYCAIVQECCENAELTARDPVELLLECIALEVEIEEAIERARQDNALRPYHYRLG